MKRELLNALFDIVDGCAVQYQCATVLYIHAQLAIQRNVPYTRTVQAPGHGERGVNGIIGGETILIRFLHIQDFTQKRMIMIPTHQCIVRITMKSNQVLQKMIWGRLYGTKMATNVFNLNEFIQFECIQFE
jgi:hypothetical protein